MLIMRAVISFALALLTGCSMVTGETPLYRQQFETLTPFCHLEGARFAEGSIFLGTASTIDLTGLDDQNRKAACVESRQEFKKQNFRIVRDPGTMGERATFSGVRDESSAQGQQKPDRRLP
jgi:hypothetical protein